MVHTEKTITSARKDTESAKAADQAKHYKLILINSPRPQLSWHGPCYTAVSPDLIYPCHQYDQVCKVSLQP